MSASYTAEELFIAELNERLFVHFTHGRWRAPLSDRLCPVLPFDGTRMGRIACAGQADIAAALAGLAVARGQPQDMVGAYDRRRADLSALRRIEGVDDPADPPGTVSLPDGTVPLILLSAATTPLSLLAGVLIAGASSRGIVWKPAPRAAASAHMLMTVLGPVAAGRLALVQGDHATGAALHEAGAAGLIWASDAPVPPEMGPPLVTLVATDRPRP